MGSPTQDAKCPLSLVASQGQVNAQALRDLRAKQLAAEFTYDSFYEQALARHPDFPDDDGYFFVALRGMAASGALYTLSLEQIYETLISAVMKDADERELFDGKRPVSRAAMIRRGKYRLQRDSCYPPYYLYRGVKQLFVHAVIICPEFPGWAWEYAEDVLRERRLGQCATLRVEQVTPELVGAVIDHWRAQVPREEALLRMFEGPPLTPAQAAAKAEAERREREEYMHRVVNGGDFPLKRKTPVATPQP